MAERRGKARSFSEAGQTRIGRIGSEVRPCDAQLLQVLGFYTDRSPLNVLRLAAWKTGENGALDAFREGRPLPADTRNLLDDMLRQELRAESDAAVRCADAAGGMAWLALDFLALAAVLLLFIG